MTQESTDGTGMNHLTTIPREPLSADGPAGDTPEERAYWASLMGDDEADEADDRPRTNPNANALDGLESKYDGMTRRQILRISVELQHSENPPGSSRWTTVLHI